MNGHCGKDYSNTMDFDRFIMYTQSKSGSDGIQSGKHEILIEIQA